MDATGGTPTAGTRPPRTLYVAVEFSGCKDAPASNCTSRVAASALPEVDRLRVVGLANVGAPVCGTAEARIRHTGE